MLNLFNVASGAFVSMTSSSSRTGTAVAVLLGGHWIRGHIEGDSEDYWLFMEAGSKIKLAKGMVVRYTEPCWYTPSMDDKLVAMLTRD